MRQGRSGGGLCFGYDVVCEHDARGDPVHGAREVNQAEAAVMRRIFAAFAEGQSPRAIALGLNAERVTGPHGKTWGPSTINGNWRRGTGVLNNELYIGKPGVEPAAIHQGPGERKTTSPAEPARRNGSSTTFPACASSTTDCGTR